MTLLNDCNIKFAYKECKRGYDLFLEDKIIGTIPYVYRISDTSYFEVTKDTMRDLVKGLNDGSIPFKFDFDNNVFTSEFDCSTGRVISNNELENK